MIGPKYIAVINAEPYSIADFNSKEIIVPYQKEEIVQLLDIIIEDILQKDIRVFTLRLFYGSKLTLAYKITNELLYYANDFDIISQIFVEFYYQINKRFTLSEKVKNILVKDMYTLIVDVAPSGDGQKIADSFFFKVNQQLLTEFSVSFSGIQNNMKNAAHSFAQLKTTMNMGNETVLGDSISDKAQRLPGMNERTCCPVNDCSLHPRNEELYSLVQHINDKHKWSREKIADWLDELADAGKINIDFSPWEDNNEQDR